MSGRSLAAAILGLWLSGLVLACGGETSPVDAPVAEAPATDPVPPERIVAIAPGVTEMLFVLGLGERVVGVGDYARWPPEAAAKPKLGGLFDSRLEAVAELDPDLAILLPSEERLRVQLEKMGVEVLTVRSETLDDVEAMAIAIGDRCGVAEAARSFVDSWRRDLALRNPPLPVRVVLSVTREPGQIADVLVSGPETFLHELVDRLGAINIMADTQLAYPQVGLEEVVVRRPQVVIELQANPGDYASLPDDWNRLAGDVVMGEICVWVIAGDHVLIPGPRLPRLYRELNDALEACAPARE